MSLKKNQLEILEVKYIIINIMEETHIDKLKSRLDPIKSRILELEDIIEESVQNKAQRDQGQHTSTSNWPSLI